MGTHIPSIVDTKELLKKKKLKEEHHVQMYKMCFDRLKKTL